MTIETFLAIASFAISIGGLIPVFFLRDRQKELSLAVVIALLVATTGVVLYRHYQHEQLINRVENEIIGKLSHNTWTVDQLYQELHYVPFPVVNEALFRGVENGVIGHRVIEFRASDGSFLHVRGYYAKSSP
ncbi:MAG: hypothetical protein JRJ69_16220 [Deltaproteobacteria bacterium]|nr:hypothetical protein [Deltaproteobacteria bacterium]